MSDYYIAIDIGAGLGAKIGLFQETDIILSETLLHSTEYGDSAESLAAALAERIESVLLKPKSLYLSDIRAIGISSPGLFRSDGTYLLANNLKYLNNRNLKQMLTEATQRPVGIENDANAGGLAEWSVLQTDLLYWVFGGGWGGAWIDADGSVRHPALDWDGDDNSLHYTNEPGYSIPLEKLTLKTMFYQIGASFDRFESILIEELNPADNIIRGPGGSADHLRAEMVLSGPGRCRLFRAIVGDDDFYERFLDIHETKQMTDPTVAGQYISKLSAMRVEHAINTDRLFGKVLAEACRVLFKQARKDGCSNNIPICLGGKPSYALPYFGPSAQRALGKMGIMSYLRPSVLDERGSNANLVGAAVLAKRVATTGK